MEEKKGIFGGAEEIKGKLINGPKVDEGRRGGGKKERKRKRERRKKEEREGC